MTKSELMQLVGKRVKVTFIKDCGGGEITGILGYAKKFSAAYGWRKPKHFTIDDFACGYDFLAIHVEKVEVLEK